jgi:hypothetical protein
VKVATKPKQGKSRATHPLMRRGRKPKEIAGDLFCELDCPCGQHFAVAGPHAFVEAAKRAWARVHAGH